MLSLFKKLMIPDLKVTASRFPLPLLCISLFTVLTIAAAHDAKWLPETLQLSRLMLTLFCGAIATTVIALYTERRSWMWWSRLCVSAAVLIAIAALLHFSAGFWLHAAFLAGGLLLLLPVAPYGLGSEDNHACCYSVSAMVVAAFFAALGMFMLCVGVSALLSSIHYLFDVRVPGKLYMDLWITGGALFAPIYFLAALPKPSDTLDSAWHYPRGVSFIVNYILSPLVLAYLVILYAYMVKIALQWTLPKGILAAMISCFGVVGVATHVLASMEQGEARPLLRWLSRYFYPTLIPPVLLLGLAIGLRIEAYGITEERYLVVLIGLWLGITALYMVSARAPRLKWIALLLGGLLVLASFGPWGAVAISAKSQTHRLEALLERHGLFSDGHIISRQEKAEIPDEDIRRIRSVISYLIDTAKFDYIRPWFPSPGMIHAMKTEDVTAFDLMAYMELAEASHTSEGTKFSFFMPWITLGKSVGIDLRGFEYFTYFPNVYLGGDPLWTRRVQMTGEGTQASESVTVSIADSVLTVRDNQERKVAFDLSALAQALDAAGLNARHAEPEERGRFVLDNRSGGLHVRLLLGQIQGRRQNGHYTPTSLEFGLLIAP